MAEPVYNADARVRIDRTVIRVEGSPLGLTETHFPTKVGQNPFWLVRCTAFTLAGNIGSFAIQWHGVFKGDEADGEDNEIDCYVRKGLCWQHGIYLAVGVCCASNGEYFEIINPTMQFNGISQAAIGPVGGSGQVRFSPSEAYTAVNVVAQYGEIDPGVNVWCSYNEFTESWFGIQQPC